VFDEVFVQLLEVGAVDEVDTRQLLRFYSTGTTGVAFADILIAETDAHVTLIDRHAATARNPELERKRTK
jgi:hypothetical protein